MANIKRTFLQQIDAIFLKWDISIHIDDITLWDDQYTSTSIININ